MVCLRCCLLLYWVLETGIHIIFRVPFIFATMFLFIFVIIASLFSFLCCFHRTPTFAWCIIWLVVPNCITITVSKIKYKFLSKTNSTQHVKEIFYQKVLNYNLLCLQLQEWRIDFLTLLCFQLMFLKTDFV